MSHAHIWEPGVRDLLDEIGTVEERRAMHEMLYGEGSGVEVPALPPVLFEFPTRAPEYERGEWDKWQRWGRSGWSSFVFEAGTPEYDYATSVTRLPRVTVLEALVGVAVAVRAVRVWMKPEQVERMNEWLTRQ